MLIKCKECNHEISDKSIACVKCGCPVKEKSQTIEKTSKKLKGQLAFCSLMIFIGLIIVFIYPITGIIITIIGLIGYLLTKSEMWWEHS